MHIDEYANVILFLIHHSNDKFVLETVRRSASALLQDQVPFSFELGPENDLLTAVNELPAAIGVQVLEDGDPDKVQREALERQDAAEADQEHFEDRRSDPEGVDEITMDGLDVLAQACVAAKTVDLLAQTLKNYYGSLKIDTKVGIGTDAVELALRALRSYLQVIGGNDGELVEALVECRREYEMDHVNQSRRMDEKELERWARDLVFSVFRFVGMIIVRKVGSVFGFEHLKPTLERLVREDALIAYRLVEIAALLEGPTEIPRAKIESLAKVLENNPLGFQILRDLVVHRIYRYPTDYREKQWLSSKLKFSMARQRSAELDVSKRIIAQ